MSPSKRSGLGNLAQSARSKELNQARWILILIGALTLVVNGFMFTRAEKEVDEEIQKEVAKGGPGTKVDTEVRTSIIRTVRMIYGGAALLGAVFVLFGL